jgi:hypothetical protein
MNDSHLPPDLDRWPSDPYRILGVPRGARPLEIKSAYARLVRTYKPEQFPEQFRRLRAAYERLRAAHGDGRKPTGRPRSALPASPARPADDPAPPTPAAHSGRPHRQHPASFHLAFEPAMQGAWEQACEGREEAAYAELLRLHAAQPGQADVCLRLYWLLALAPGLDAHRAPRDWLLTGLGSRQHGGLLELLCREAADDPAAALDPRCARLLETLPQIGSVSELAQCRWQGAARAGQAVPAIVADLDRLRPRLAGVHDTAWGRLLLAALRHLAWETGPVRAAAATLRGELESLTHIHRQLAQELTELDYLWELAAERAALVRANGAPKPGRLTADIVELAQQSFVFSQAYAAERADALALRIAAAPLAGLLALRRTLGSAPRLASWFDGLLAALLEQRGEPRRAGLPDELDEEIWEELDAMPWSKYDDVRDTLLAYCLRAAVSPERVAAAARRQDRFRTGPKWEFSDRLDADRLLHCVWRSCQLVQF